MVVNAKKKGSGHSGKKKPAPAIHSIGTHYQQWKRGQTCHCKFWKGDVQQFDMHPDYKPTGVKVDSHKYLRIPAWNMCPVCELTLSTDHEHYYSYVESLLGEDIADNYQRMFSTTPDVKPAVEKSVPPTTKDTDQMNVYRIRTMDRSRKLAIQRVLKGRRRVAVKQACTDMHFLLQYTWLDPKVSLTRCEPLLHGDTKK